MAIAILLNGAVTSSQSSPIFGLNIHPYPLLFF